MDKTLAAVENKKAHLKMTNDEVSLSWIIWVAIRIARSSLGSNLYRFFLRPPRSDQDRY